MPPKNNFEIKQISGFDQAWDNVANGRTKITGTPVVEAPQLRLQEAAVPAVPLIRAILPYAATALAGAGYYATHPQAITVDLSDALGNAKYNLMNMWHNVMRGHIPQMQSSIDPNEIYARPVEVTDAIATPNVMMLGRNTLPKGFKKREDVVVLPGGERVDSGDVTQRGDTTIVKGKGMWDKRGVRIGDAPVETGESTTTSGDPENKPENKPEDKKPSDKDPDDKKKNFVTKAAQKVKDNPGKSILTALALSSYPAREWIWPNVGKAAKWFAVGPENKTDTVYVDSNSGKVVEKPDTVKKEESKVETPVQETVNDSLPKVDNELFKRMNFRSKK